ncbi:MAG: acetate--CoA ligase family protein [Pseudomonadota bacterium]
MGRLDRLLRPNSVAVIGGGSWCENVLRECRKAGFAGELWAVHPTREEVGGCRAYPGVEALPGPPDAAFIGVNRISTVDVVRSLAAVGAGGAVCFASGFSEAADELDGAEDLQEKLIEAADGMPFLGPNCYGFINALDGMALWPDQHGMVRAERGVAIISQSSNIALNLTMQTRGLPISYLMTVGNQAAVGLSEIGQAMVADDRVTAIGLYLEGLDDLAAFEQFAGAARAAGKPVVAIKIGRSERSQAATMSHTASLAGSMAGANALFARLSISQVTSLTELLETLKIFHVAGPLPSDRVACMACSGGEASLMGDVAVGSTVTFPQPSGPQRDQLRSILGPMVTLANPLDYHTFIWGDIPAMADCFAAMVAGSVSMGIVVLDIPRQDRCAPDEWLKTVEAIKKAKQIAGKPFAMLSSLPEGLPEPLAASLLEDGIVPLCGMDDAVSAISAAAQSSGSCAPVLKPRSVAMPRRLEEDEAKTQLGAFGLPVPRRSFVCGAEEAVEAAQRLGYPVVLKGTGLAHKTEAGAVALNLMSAADVREAAGQMPSDTLLVEEMVQTALAELLVGVVLDPAHGYVLTLAAGGVLTELLRDRQSLLLPATRDEVRTALGRLSYGKVLQGYRGSPACDVDAIVDAVMALQDYVTAVPISEIEVNPLLCGKDFAIAADALIIAGDPE